MSECSFVCLNACCSAEMLALKNESSKALIVLFLKDIPPGEAPGAATNLTLTQEAGGWVLRWVGPPDDSKLIYYTVQIKKDSQGEEWMPLTDSKIDVEEASYMSMTVIDMFNEHTHNIKPRDVRPLVKNMGTAKAYLFRVFSHSPTSYSISEVLKYDLPENVKRRAVTAGLIGGILFFIVAIVLSVCTVKICNKRRRRKQERGELDIQRFNNRLETVVTKYRPKHTNNEQLK